MHCGELRYFCFLSKEKHCFCPKHIYHFFVRLAVVPHLDQVWAHHCNEWRVVLRHWGESHSKLGLTESRALEHHIRLLTPGNKEAVVLHTSYHFIDLLHGIPGERASSEKPSSDVCRSACQSVQVSCCDITLQADRGCSPMSNCESFIVCTLQLHKYITVMALSIYTSSSRGSHLCIEHHQRAT